MTREVRDIPPAPRSIRWTSVIWCRWPLGLAAALLTVYGGLVTLLFLFASGGKPSDDARLDAAMHSGSLGSASATVDEVREHVTMFGRTSRQLFYHFRIADHDVRGKSFIRTNPPAPGSHVDVDYLPDEPSLSRLHGTRISRLANFVTPAFFTLVMPGLLLLAVWMLGVLRLRRTLALGDTTVGQVLRLEPVRFVVPMMLRVDYRFRDYRARWCQGRHWVRARSTTGAALRTSRRGVVICDRRHPEHNRLVALADFRAIGRPEGQAAERV